MNQTEIGKYISERRKAKSLTQKQLAELIGVTDKTVSKWETGMRMPDAILLVDLCQVLETDINELLAGEALQREDYTARAESNLVELVGELNTIKEESKGKRMGTIVGSCFIVLALVSIMADAVGGFGLNSFIDVPTMLCLLGVTFLMIAMVGYAHDYKNAFVFCFTGKCMPEKDIRSAVCAMQFACWITLTVGLLISVIGGISALGAMSDPAAIGPSLARTILSVFYTLLLEIMNLSLLFRLRLLDGRARKQ